MGVTVPSLSPAAMSAAVASACCMPTTLGAATSLALLAFIAEKPQIPSPSTTSTARAIPTHSSHGLLFLPAEAIDAWLGSCANTRPGGHVGMELVDGFGDEPGALDAANGVLLGEADHVGE